MSKKLLIGFIGQGWIGKNYADDFENRGYKVIRYSLEPAFVENKDKIADCDIVFVAVPTPTTKKGFDDSILIKALEVTGRGSLVVIKSTIPIGKTLELQKKFKDRYIVHSPEFLVEATARFDASNPERNIIGIPHQTKKYKDLAKKIMSVLPPAPFALICLSNEAEMIKYAHNIHGYFEIVLTNILYDMSKETGMDWDVLKKSFEADRMMSKYYLNPVHKSGRGAGGHCFVKDFEAFIEMYKKILGADSGLRVLESVRNKNISLLTSTKKDLDILGGVYKKSLLQKTSEIKRKKPKK